MSPVYTTVSTSSAPTDSANPARDHPHARAQLVEHDQRDGGQGQHPQEPVAELRAEERMGGDAGGVVIGQSREEPGPTTAASTTTEPA